MNELLNDLYTKPESGAAFSSKERLYREAKKIDKKVTRKRSQIFWNRKVHILYM